MTEALDAAGNVMMTFVPKAAKPPKEKPLPHTAEQFAKQRAAFEAWLLARGSAIMAPTNPYEVMRFIGDKGNCIIYRNERCTITAWVNGADAIFRCFLAGDTNWRAVARNRRERNTKRSRLIASLVLRDGWSCMYCGHMTNGDTATIEHVVSQTHGGPDHMANLSLAHRECNTAASHLSAREKVEMAIRMRRSSES